MQVGLHSLGRLLRPQREHSDRRESSAPKLASSFFSLTLRVLALQVNNCGSRGNVCSLFANGNGKQCVAGRCQPMSCNPGFDFNLSTNKCQDVRTDNQNW